MLDFKEKLAQFKKDNKGAACFYAPASDSKFCGGQLTQAEAIKFASVQGLTLLDWQQGKSCSQMNCK
ncbi:hypothetical protein EZ456_20795 [Pedobacter psychrodurus]|uniref:Uncharacterized protein n=1 Tax=Pedobacter psychrodurus TaxID=2530456 RepID=A0A4V2MPG0_9SPHI|nr:hypothetical protein [Pedobacter psychrodurus]TCD18937.1 hypothetical protein EZ456_20795 [Pedobacter psychrodurus]